MAEGRYKLNISISLMLQSTIIQWSKILSIYLYLLFIRKEVQNHAGFNDVDNNNQEKKYSLVTTKGTHATFSEAHYCIFRKSSIHARTLPWNTLKELTGFVDCKVKAFAVPSAHI